jgi:hypothetical protein
VARGSQTDAELHIAVIPSEARNLAEAFWWHAARLEFEQAGFDPSAARSFLAALVRMTKGESARQDDKGEGARQG